MRAYIILFLITFCLAVTSITAEARFGGSRSFGLNRTLSSNHHYNFSRNENKSSFSGNRWLAPLTGLAIGGLLGALIGHGIGSSMLVWLIIGSIIFFVLRLYKTQSSRKFATMQSFTSSSIPAQTIEGKIVDTTSSHSSTQFNEDVFLRQAKAIFIRLQASYDKKNLSDIRMFTSSEVFAEIQLQLQEREDTNHFTEVLDIQAQLADLDIKSDNITASVIFSGKIREAREALPIEIKETWHFQQFKNNLEWVVIGVQQQ